MASYDNNTGQATKYNDEIDYSKPDFDTPENEKVVEWYKRNIRYYSKYYNVNYTTWQPDDYRGNTTPVQRGLTNMLYYEGKQQNIDYNYATKDLSNNTLTSIWIPGKKIKSMVDHLLGVLKSQIDNKIIAATSLSKKALNKRQQMFDDIMLKYDEQATKIFDELKEVGIEFKPVGREFKDKEEAEKWFKTSYKENAEIYSVDIAKYIEESNDSDSHYFKLFLDYLAANYCAMYNYIENGKIKQKQIPFYNIIFDAIDGDGYNRNARFCGFRETLSPQEIFLNPNWILTDEEKQEIKTYTSQKDAWQEVVMYYNQPNINWWSNYVEIEKVISCVTMFWRNQRDTRYDMNIDKYGNPHYVKIKSGKKNGEYWVDDIYKGTLIGNKYLVDYGLLNNVVRDPKDKSKPQFPIKVLTGGIVLGDGTPFIGQISQNQDRLDLYRFKIIEEVGKASGKCYILNGHKLGETITGKQLMIDFKTMGISVFPGSSGEPDDINDTKPVIEMIDLSMSPDVQRYLELIREEERIMEEACNLSKIALGQQSNTIGKAVQQNTVAASSEGLALLYHNFIRFNEMNLQMACNMAIQLYASGKADDAEIVVGDRGMKFVKTAKELGFDKFEDMLIWLKTKDVVGQEVKQRMLGIAQAAVQNSKITMLDFVRIEKAESLTEIEHLLELSLKKQEEKEDQMREQQAQQEQAMHQQEIDAKNQQSLLAQHAETQRSGDRNAAKIQEANIKAGVIPPK